jgi:hypothetical protein
MDNGSISTIDLVTKFFKIPTEIDFIVVGKQFNYRLIFFEPLAKFF